MPSAVRLREDYSAEALRGWPAGRRTSTRAGGFCRWLRSETEWTEGAAAKIGGMDRQTLRDWVHRFNASGPEGLIDNWTEGPEASAFGGASWLEFAQIVEAGPDREKDGVVRWRRIDLKRVIAERFGVDFHPALCREASARSSASPTSAHGRVIRRKTSGSSRRSKTYGPPRLQGGLSRLAADPVCINVSGLEELPPAMMEIRTLRSS